MGNEVSNFKDEATCLSRSLEMKSESDIPMPWFGMDIGGTLTKLVYFEPTDKVDDEIEAETLTKIRRYLTDNKAYGSHGHRDIHLSMTQISLDEGNRIGTLHFIRFPTSEMESFLSLAIEKGMASLSSTVCATGGGAMKYDPVFRKLINMNLHKFDELDSLIIGLHYIVSQNSSELFYVSELGVKIPFPFSGRSLYPFLLVNIGSGVSILSVTSPSSFKRIYGTSLGGGTFLGLCRLLTQCSSFEEALHLAEKGSNTSVDTLVSDIYGGDYERFHLSGDTVASSFGKITQGISTVAEGDLARATLVTITNNIGSIAHLCAKSESINTILFVGNFLRINEISMKLLSSAMHFWSKGSIKALFCQHEGYFGAIGCLLELMKTKN